VPVERPAADVANYDYNVLQYDIMQHSWVWQGIILTQREISILQVTWYYAKSAA